MKANIHPQLNPVVFIDTSTGAEFITSSTLTSDQKKKINGVDHYVIKVEISSASHPFYTGKRKLVDTAGRVDKFLARAKRAQQLQEKKVKSIDKELDDILHEEEKKEKTSITKEAKAEESKSPKKKPVKKTEPKKAASKVKKPAAKKTAKTKKSEK